MKAINKKHGEIFRCQKCGKFIGYNEIPSKVKVDFTFDTKVTVEETLFTHNACYKPNNVKQ